MNNFQPTNTLANYIFPNEILPDDWEECRESLTDYLIRSAYAVNTREISNYESASLDGSGINVSVTPNGQTWFRSDNVNLFRYGSRTVVNITGGLLNHGGGTATQSQAHGIQTTQNTRFTRIYGCATDPGASTLDAAIPIPYVDVDTLANGIELWVDATNVNLRYGANYSSYTEAYVILEWVENV